jgi:hypothetical protein
MGSAVINAVTDSIYRTSGPAYNAFTMAFWVKMDPSIADFSTSNLCFINAGWSYYMGIRIVVGDGTGLETGARLVLTGGGFTDAQGPVAPDYDPDFDRGEWLYLALTSAGAVTDGAKAYLWTADGTLQQSLSGTPTGSGTLDQIEIGDLAGDSTIGKYAYGRVWSRVLTPANLEAEMFSPTVVGTTDIYSAFEDDPSTDVSGQSHPFSITSIGTGSDTPPVLTGCTITDAGDELYRAGDSVTITGTNFGAVEGDVYVSPTDDVTNAAKVAQTVTSWADTSITFTAVRSTLATGSTLYLFVVPDTNDENADGYSVAFEYVPITLTWAM